MSGGIFTVTSPSFLVSIILKSKKFWYSTSLCSILSIKAKGGSSNSMAVRNCVKVMESVLTNISTPALPLLTVPVKI